MTGQRADEQVPGPFVYRRLSECDKWLHDSFPASRPDIFLLVTRNCRRPLIEPAPQARDAKLPTDRLDFARQLSDDRAGELGAQEPPASGVHGLEEALSARKIKPSVLSRLSKHVRQGLREPDHRRTIKSQRQMLRSFPQRRCGSR